MNVCIWLYLSSIFLNHTKALRNSKDANEIIRPDNLYSAVSVHSDFKKVGDVRGLAHTSGARVVF